MCLPPASRTASSYDWSTVLQVCTRWRDLAISLPHLWNTRLAVRNTSLPVVRKRHHSLYLTMQVRQFVLNLEKRLDQLRYFSIQSPVRVAAYLP